MYIVQLRGTVLYICLEDVFCTSFVVLITWANHSLIVHQKPELLFFGYTYLARETGRRHGPTRILPLPAMQADGRFIV
jgi:hypothetical protein